MKTHNPIIIDCKPRLARSNTILSYFPATKPLATRGFSWPGGSAPSWLPPSLLQSSLLLLSSSSTSPPTPTLKPPLPPFPSTAQSQALVSIEQLKQAEGPHEITRVHAGLLIRRNPSRGSRISIRIQKKHDWII